MEYMLLSDGSVKTFECLPLHQDVRDALNDYDGVAHYWWNDSFKWCVITNDTPNHSSNQVSGDLVPDVIKLAAMLE